MQRFTLCDAAGVILWVDRMNAGIQDAIGRNILEWVREPDRDAVVAAMGRAAMFGRAGPIRLETSEPSGGHAYEVNYVAVGEAGTRGAHDM